jgi:hypothetical protein
MEDLVNIKECEKLYPDEWLLFEVVEVDEMNRPLKGRLLAHSKDRDEVHKVAMDVKPKIGYTTYSGELIPKDMAVAL